MTFPKPRCRLLLIAIVVIALVGLVAIRQLNAPVLQPVYRGRSLATWIADLDPRTSSYTQRTEAMKAIQQIGTGAVPWLLMCITNSSQSLTRSLISGDSKDRARVGFAALGELGDSAIPALTALVMAGSCEQAMVASDVLPGMGIHGEDALLAGLRHPDERIRVKVAKSLVSMPEAARRNLGPLLRALTDTSFDVTFWVGSAIGQCQANPELLIPKLSEMLEFTNAAIRYGCVVALDSLPGGARHLWDSSSRLLNDPNEDVRAATRDALRSLTQKAVPEATAKDRLTR